MTRHRVRLARLERARLSDAGLPPILIVVSDADLPLGQVVEVARSEGVMTVRCHPLTDLPTALPAAGIAFRAAWPAPMTAEQWTTFHGAVSEIEEEDLP